MGKTIDDLRDAMFDTLAQLKAGKITVDQAKAISEVGQVIINSAKVEVDFHRANTGGKMAFLEPPKEGQDHTEVKDVPTGVVRVVTHRMK